ncbi:hypothetical protein HOE04_00840 [archaeon]|jgi:flagellin-like protein|nr:hypothetical protein [archaeon]
MNSKKSQSQVITTVLLILITISLIVVISAFAISFVNNKLSDSDCLDIADKVTIINDLRYTCYDSNGKLNLQVHVGDIEEGEIEGFTISVSSEGSSNSYEIPEDPNDKVTMFKPPTEPLEIPSKNTEKTYTITDSTLQSIPDTIKIYPILKDGKTCDASDTYKFIATCDENI